MIINSFKGEYAWLSNFYKANQVANGFITGNNESFYQAMKTIDAGERSAILDMSPKEAKAAGRKVKLRDDWHLVKDAFMLEGLRAKFSQGDLRIKLITTENVQLVEGNKGHDNYWGDCSCSKCKDIPGMNKLGNLLMKVRAELTGLKVWTAQMSKTKGKGWPVLDITVKSKDPFGKTFAPTWDMVMGIKNGTMTEAEYASTYYSMMFKSMVDKPNEWSKLLSMGEVVLMCFCPANKFCHRHLLVEVLRTFKVIKYVGEL